MLDVQHWFFFLWSTWILAEKSRGATKCNSQSCSSDVLHMKVWNCHCLRECAEGTRGLQPSQAAGCASVRAETLKCQWGARSANLYQLPEPTWENRKAAWKCTFQEKEKIWCLWPPIYSVLWMSLVCVLLKSGRKLLSTFQEKLNDK